MTEIDSNLTSAELVTLVRVSVRDEEGEPPYVASFHVVTKDIGATIGAAVYFEGELVHAFHAHTRYPNRAEEIVRDLLHETADDVRREYGARSVARYHHVADRFKAITREHGHKPLDPSEMQD